MKVLHICNSFDPAGDCVRAVKELQKYSRHEHKLYVHELHPLQHIYQYEEAENCGWKMAQEQVVPIIEWADAILHEFVGWENGWGDPAKRAAFRNINIYWDKVTDRFWSSPMYNAASFGRYKLFASSHVGAAEFLPEPFTWLPDLLPLDGAYRADFSERPKNVSYIKHWKSLNCIDFGVPHQDLHNTPNFSVIENRRLAAYVVIDNICDGHFGLAGNEAVTLGLPTICYNHLRTRVALDELAPGDYPPFFECGPSIEEAAEKVREILAIPDVRYKKLRREIRGWAERHLAPENLIVKFWDPFVDKLGSEVNDQLGSDRLGSRAPA